MAFPPLGTYPLVANNYKGKLKIEYAGDGDFDGYLQFEGYALERIQHGKIVTYAMTPWVVSNVISFTRVLNPEYRQRYIGQAFLAFPDNPTGDGHTELWVMTGHFVELKCVTHERPRGGGQLKVWETGMPFVWSAGPNDTSLEGN